MFIGLLNFVGSLATTCVSVINETGIVRLTFIDLDLVELNYYLFTNSLDKCNESCDAVTDSSAKISVPSKIKDIDIKVFNMTIITYKA